MSPNAITATWSLHPDVMEKLVDIDEQFTSVRSALKHFVDTNPQHQEDEGLWNIFVAILNVTLRYRIPPRAEPAVEMTANVTDMFTAEVVPAYQAVITLVQKAWDDMRAALEDGGSTDELLVTFMEENETAVAALDDAVTKAQNAAARAFIDRLFGSK